MASPHSTVTYVEPNIILKDWQHNDTYERAPRLEDYCVAMNIEVEVCSRDSQGSINDGDKEVLILQWNNSDGSSVSFMAGTKIGGYEYNGINRTPRLKNTNENLTTYYADMYVGDLIHYGTTEMLGIKSVDIQYEKSCVPIITVQFTDVRGLSLFQPTELSRDNTYNGIKGLNKDNIAQSFFQCFFKMPLPKFTFYIKGFYGDPVAYICMCDKFDTNFNSDTGDFDVTARFIGYSYSFMTDVSLDALLAAPYSDFEGKKYWDDNVNNDRFWIWDKYHTHHMKMPTLFEIRSDFMSLFERSNEDMENTTLTEEERNHKDEIAKLNDIIGKYNLWYQNLYEAVKSKYGKRYCFDFMDGNGKEANWERIIILRNSTNIDSDLSYDYEQFPDEIKEETNALYATIENFNNSGYSYRKLNNVSKDFSSYKKVKLFNDCYVNKNTKKIEFGGFSLDNKLNRQQVINRLFHNSMTSAEAKVDTTYSDYTLSTIYADGVDQYKDAFVIEVDYSDIRRRIKALQNHANKSDDAKEKERRRKEYNRIMFSKMNWYPSIENFTKIMMAHLETFMMMMYKVAELCSDRTPENLGITIGRNGNACDVPENSTTVPPFPRVVKEEVGDDGITKTVDTWVGDYDGGKKFVEADMINGLFNAVNYILRLYGKEKEKEQGNSQSNENAVPTVKHPITSYDFHLTKKVYGLDNDISNNPNAFAGKIAMRMFDILSISNFRKQYNNKISKKNTDFIRKLGEIEAKNFYNDVSISNKGLLGLLGIDGSSGTITPQSIIDCVKSNAGIGGNNEIPWNTDNAEDALFDKNLWLTKYVASYDDNKKSYIYPMQNTSFDKLNEAYKIFSKSINTIQADNNDIIVNWINTSGNADALLNSSNDNCFGSVFISDNFKIVENGLEGANTPDNTYKDVYDMLHGDSIFNEENFGKMILEDGVFVPKLNVKTPKTPCKLIIKDRNDESLNLYIYKKGDEMVCDNAAERAYYAYDVDNISSYTSEAANGNISSWFISECRGFHHTSDGYTLLKKVSLPFQYHHENLIYSASGWSHANSAEEKRIGFFLMGIEAINFSEVNKHLYSDESFTYLPKLAVLQMGAALASLDDSVLGSYTRNIGTILAYTLRTIPMPSTFQNVVPYLNKINYTTRIAYIKYFKNWVSENSGNIFKNFLNTDSQVSCKYIMGVTNDSSIRAIFREDSEIVASLTNNLMSPVLVTKATVNHFYGTSKNGLDIDDNVATVYLESFLNKVRELYGVNTEAEKGGNGVQLVKEPDKTTEAMKKELYRYLKLVYDKWVPATEKESWKFETFFSAQDENKIRGKKGCDGHLFHFIDSFYNKIGDKLLINPKLLCEKFDAALDTNDVNVMMLGFMADIYSQNKCMMLCLQNFLDLGKENGSMERMFTPIPYNEMPQPHKHPDFVVVYPYEPSKYLNVDNSEFNNDSFMLNEETESPMAVRSRDIDNDNCYRIPAFGVSYGKQYQSYFKKVSVGMANPIATQQSIMAKHAILRDSKDVSTKTVVAQDMYDIYTTQSYTCKVEMMGCAWIQPLMYFVLTNVPMFRGSYLIFKVNHKITPGNMITEFQGTRMANVANKLVEDIFSDEDYEGDNSFSNSYDIHAKADIDNDNDCPYKVYPLFDSSEGELTGDELQKASALMDKLMALDYTKEAAAGIVGNISVEVGQDFDHTKMPDNEGGTDSDGYCAAGICQWNDHYGNLTKFLRKDTTRYGQAEKDGSIKRDSKNLGKNKIKSMLSSKDYDIDYQISFLNDTISQVTVSSKSTTKYSKAKINSCKTASEAAESFRAAYERGDKAEERKTRAKKYYDNYQKSSVENKQTPDKDIKNDIYDAFFKALQKSLDSTNRGCTLNPKMYIKSSEYSDGIMMITQVDGKSDKLPLVFDIILNGYYQYVQKLWWVSPSNDMKGNPAHIDVTVLQEPKVESRTILAMVSGKANEALKIKFGSDATSVNESLLKSIYKKYKGVHKEIPQFDNKEIFKDMEIQDCNTVGSNGSYYPSQGSNSTWAKSVQSMGKWYEANIHTYQGKTPPNKGSGTRKMYNCDLLGGKVGDDCSGYVSACLQYFGVFKKGYITNSGGFVRNTDVANMLQNGKFKKLSYSWDNVQPYDIIAYNNGGSGHVEILAEKGEHPKSWGWGSVHDGQNGRAGMPAGTGDKPKGSTYTVIWRYIG